METLSTVQLTHSRKSDFFKALHINLTFRLSARRPYQSFTRVNLGGSLGSFDKKGEFVNGYVYPCEPICFTVQAPCPAPEARKVKAVEESLFTFGHIAYGGVRDGVHVWELLEMGIVSTENGKKYISVSAQ